MTTGAAWHQVFEERRRPLERSVAAYLPTRRWFGGKARTVAGARIIERLTLPGSSCLLTLVSVRYEDGGRETYVLPLACASGEGAAEIERAAPEAIVARSRSEILYDAVYDPSFGPRLVEAIARRRPMVGRSGIARSSATPLLARLWRGGEAARGCLLGAEQSNSSIRIGDRVLLKLIRKAESGVNPELEIGRFLARRHSVARVPPLAGALEYHREGRREPATLLIVQGFVSNQADGWSYTLDSLRGFLDGILKGRRLEAPPATAGILELSAREPSTQARDSIGDYLRAIELLGRRTAELHLALGGPSRAPSFAPEPWSSAYRRSLEKSLRTLTVRVFRQLRERVSRLPSNVGSDVASLLACEAQLLGRFRSMGERELSGRRIRGHGDFHLGQVLKVGEDFVIIDFEGEPARSIRERRVKHSPLRDVAGMLRSFHYAAAIAGQGASTAAAAPEDLSRLESAARFWRLTSSAAFLRAYLSAVSPGRLLPRSHEELSFLLDALTLEKAIYELGYELNHRPAWIGIPAQAVLETIGGVK